MTALQDEMLRILWEAGPQAEVTWLEDGRRHHKCPHPGALKALVREGLVEAETRTCSTWMDKTAPRSEDFYLIEKGMRGKFDGVAWRAAQEAWESQRKFRSRVEIVARLLPKGIWHCTNVLGLN